MRYRVNFIIVSTFVILLSTSLGCGTASSPSNRAEKSSRVDPNETTDGLVKVESAAPGDLYLRTNHGIGGYDAVAIAPAFVTYQRKSPRLDSGMEDLYLVSLEQALYDEAESLGVEILNQAGNCVIKIGIGFVNVALARDESAEFLGRMTMVIEYQDSMSGESLLRYVAPQKIKRERDGTSREVQISRSFDRMIDGVDMTTALRKATVVPSPPREGCAGSLTNARPSNNT